jgi:DNA (cytosine-5)-methyltransferase 1
VSPTLNAFDNTGDSRATVIIFQTYGGNKRPDRPNGGFYVEETEQAKTLDSSSGLNPSANQGGVIIFTAQRVGEPPRIYENTTPSLLSRMGTGGNNTPMIAFSHTQGLDPQPSEIATPTLQVGGAGMAALTDTVVRRLTPTECERLMGWPDNHTLYRADGKTNSDSTRYKMCGNGVATPVARFIAEQLRPLLET